MNVQNENEKLNEFKTTLKSFWNIRGTKVLGINDTTITSNVQEIQFSSQIIQLAIYSFEEQKLVNIELSPSFDLLEIQTLILKIVKITQSACKYSQSFSFQKFYIKNYKIIAAVRESFVVIAIGTSASNSTVLKTSIIHTFISFVNFNGNLVSRIEEKQFRDAKTHFSLESKDSENEYTKTEYFQLKIYEIYFAKSISMHFLKNLARSVKQEELSLTNVKFQNMYVIDISSQVVIFNLSRLQNDTMEQRYLRKKAIWKEIIYHAKILKENYTKQYELEYKSAEVPFHFVKFECTSTYPRLTFVVKFLPLLEGLAVVHVYSQNRLSRNQENDKNNEYKSYKEYDLLFGNVIKKTNNMQFKFQYTEPKKLQQLETLFVEFFVCIRKQSNFYFLYNHEVKYFSYDLISVIENTLCENRMQPIDNIIQLINDNLYQAYIKLLPNGSDEPFLEKSIEQSEDKINYQISQSDILNNIFGFYSKSNRLKKTISLNSENLGNKSFISEESRPSVFSKHNISIISKKSCKETFGLINPSNPYPEHKSNVEIVLAELEELKKVKRVFNPNSGLNFLRSQKTDFLGIKPLLNAEQGLSRDNQTEKFNSNLQKLRLNDNQSIFVSSIIKPSVKEERNDSLINIKPDLRDKKQESIENNENDKSEEQFISPKIPAFERLESLNLLVLNKNYKNKSQILKLASQGISYGTFPHQIHIDKHKY